MTNGNTTNRTDTMKIESTTIYLTDNGAALCGDHLGMTARTTGRDISGQPIHPVDPATAREMDEIAGRPLCCEACGRKAAQ